MSLEEIGISPDFVAAARRCHLDVSTEKDAERLRRADWRPLQGGFNNKVYRIECRSRQYCLKFYKVDDRPRAQREWAALRFLARRGFDYAPTPFYYEEDPRAPLVVMEFFEGVQLGRAHLFREQLDMLVRRVKELQAIAYEPGIEGLAALEGLTRLEGMVSFMAAADPLCREGEECLELWGKWMRGEEPAMVRTPAGLIFTRMDTNLDNCLWDGQNLRFVDLEYGGWTDQAFDLAEQVEHDQSRGTPDETWAYFVEQFDLGSEERCRLVAARRVMAFFWARLFWPREGTGALPKFRAQVARVRKLCTREL